MEVRDLKNYGKPMSESQRGIPHDAQKEMKRIGREIIRRRLGLIKTLWFAGLIPIHRMRFSRRDLSRIRDRGVSDEGFIAFIIERTAVYSALAQLIGRGEAVKVHEEIMDVIAPIVNSHMFSSAEDFSAFVDPFAAFKQYLIAAFEANRRAGLHDFDVVEDGRDAFQIDIKYCAYFEIRKELGMPEAALPSCYGDDVYIPPVALRAGIRFLRTGTLARGNPVCDFRFERIKDQRA